MSVLNGTAHPCLSGRAFTSMVDSVRDVQDNQDKTTTPYLLLIGGRDKIVDNAGANNFYNTKQNIPEGHKQKKQYIMGCHCLWQEPQYRARLYEDTYGFITKIINDKKHNPKSLILNDFKDFKVGRPENARDLPVKRFLVATASLLYLLTGFFIWILTKVFK